MSTTQIPYKPPKYVSEEISLLRKCNRLCNSFDNAAGMLSLAPDIQRAKWANEFTPDELESLPEDLRAVMQVLIRAATFFDVPAEEVRAARVAERTCSRREEAKEVFKAEPPAAPAPKIKVLPPATTPAARVERLAALAKTLCGGASPTVVADAPKTEELLAAASAVTSADLKALPLHVADAAEFIVKTANGRRANRSTLQRHIRAIEDWYRSIKE